MLTDTCPDLTHKPHTMLLHKLGKVNKLKPQRHSHMGLSHKDRPQRPCYQHSETPCVPKRPLCVGTLRHSITSHRPSTTHERLFSQHKDRLYLPCTYLSKFPADPQLRAETFPKIPVSSVAGRELFPLPCHL